MDNIDTCLMPFGKAYVSSFYYQKFSFSDVITYFSLGLSTFITGYSHTLSGKILFFAVAYAWDRNSAMVEIIKRCDALAPLPFHSHFFLHRVGGGVAAPNARRRTRWNTSSRRNEKIVEQHAIHAIDIIVSIVVLREMVAIPVAVIASKSLSDISFLQR